MSPKRCPGCSHPIPATDPWCTPCHLRLPAHLQQELEHTQRSLRALQASVRPRFGLAWHGAEREQTVLKLTSEAPGDRRWVSDQGIMVTPMHNVRISCDALS